MRVLEPDSADARRGTHRIVAWFRRMLLWSPSPGPIRARRKGTRLFSKPRPGRWVAWHPAVWQGLEGAERE